MAEGVYFMYIRRAGLLVATGACCAGERLKSARRSSPRDGFKLLVGLDVEVALQVAHRDDVAELRPYAARPIYARSGEPFMMPTAFKA